MGRRAERVWGFGATCAALFATAACAPRVDLPAAVATTSATVIAPADPVDPVETILAPAQVEYERFRGLSYGAYLPPKSGLVAEDGGVDVVFHFHAGQMSEKDFRESNLNAVFVSCGFGIGSDAYSTALADPGRFDRMIAELMKSLTASPAGEGRKDLHVRHLALVSWSAGFSAVSRILSVPRYYAMTEAVFLLDSIHSLYVDPSRRAPAQGIEQVDLKGIDSFVRYARDAARGDKTMVITHSSIVPPDYASSSEATGALLRALDVPKTPSDETNARGMKIYYRAESEGLHVTGFRGQGPRDHFAHLHLVGDAVRSFLLPRWSVKG